MAENKHVSSPTAMSDIGSLIEAHTAALAEYDALDDQQYGKPAVRGSVEAKMEETRRAIIEHRPNSLAEVKAKADFMASCRTFAGWDDIDRLGLIRALMPEEGDPKREGAE